MKNVSVVIGANFGDEGKGLVTNQLALKSKKEGKNCCVVLHNGTCQRGHTVILPDGARHVFKHFGSGTGVGAATYIADSFFVNPIFFREEFEELRNLGYFPEVYMSSNCPVITPYDMMLNQITEEAREKEKHGSCGMGLFEAQKRMSITYPELVFLSLEKNNLIFCREYIKDEIQKRGIKLSDEWQEIIYLEEILDRFMEDLEFMHNHVTFVEPQFLETFEDVIFECGQGLLLDRDNEEYFPHLTPSNTGCSTPMKLVRSINWRDDINLEYYYVSRTYLTRHGAGRLDRECKKEEISEKIGIDLTNVPNSHQDVLRYALLDYKELNERILADKNHIFDWYDECEVKTFPMNLVFTHCNEVPLNMNKIKNNMCRIWVSDKEKGKDVMRRI